VAEELCCAVAYREIAVELEEKTHVAVACFACHEGRRAMLLIVKPNGRAAELVEGVAVWYGFLRGIAEENRGCDCVCHVTEGFIAVVVVHYTTGAVLADSRRSGRESWNMMLKDSRFETTSFFSETNM